MNQNLIKTFQQRGYFNQCTDLDNLTKLLDNKKIKLYIGFDCTAPSLHVGVSDGVIVGVSDGVIVGVSDRKSVV
jgi:tyrosyl-tRNA synthetase